LKTNDFGSLFNCGPLSVSLVSHYLVKSETLKLCCMEDVLLVGTVCHSEGCGL